MAAGKRYIVTFEQEDVAESAAASLLKITKASKRKMRKGISHLESAADVDDNDVLHFQEIGASVATLTARQVKDLENDRRVAEVVEDYEVFALACGCSDGDGAGRAGAASWGGGYAASSGGAGAGPGGYPRAYWADDAQAAGSDATANATCPPGHRRFCINLGPWLPPLCFCLPVAPPVGGSPTPTPTPTRIPWNISMIKADQVWHRTTGRGVKVAVIDTGIDDNHPDLSVSGGASMVPGVSHWNDDQGHGTHCAGTIGAKRNSLGVVGVAPDASLYGVKVLNAQGSGRLSWILAGMGWAEQNGMDVASMSLGSDVSSANASCTLAYQRAAERLNRRGCTIIAAAGNAGRTSTPWVGNPARCAGFMAVAAVDRNRQIADFSSRGPAGLCHDCGVEISAPGVRIESTKMGGGTTNMSGTSMACPHVAGAAALLKEFRPSWTPAQIRARLRAKTSDLGAPGNDPTFGSGLLDCHRAIFG